MKAWKQRLRGASISESLGDLATEAEGKNGQEWQDISRELDDLADRVRKLEDPENVFYRDEDSRVWGASTLQCVRDSIARSIRTQRQVIGDLRRQGHDGAARLCQKEIDILAGVVFKMGWGRLLNRPHAHGNGFKTYKPFGNKRV